MKVVSFAVFLFIESRPNLPLLAAAVVFTTAPLELRKIQL